MLLSLFWELLPYRTPVRPISQTRRDLLGFHFEYPWNFCCFITVQQSQDFMVKILLLINLKDAWVCFITIRSLTKDQER